MSSVTPESEWSLHVGDLIVVADGDENDVLVDPAAQIESRDPEYDEAIEEAVAAKAASAIKALVQKDYADNHPRWPAGAPLGKGGEFMRVGERFTYKNKTYEITTIHGSRVTANIATGGPTADEVSLDGKTKAGKTTINVQPADPKPIKGHASFSEKAQGQVTVSPYVDSSTHDPSIEKPEGTGISDKEWARFGREDQEHFLYLLDRFGAWSPGKSHEIISTVSKKYSTQAQSTVKAAFSGQYGSGAAKHKGKTLSLAALFNGIKVGDKEGLANAQGQYEEAKLLLRDMGEVIQWDTYHRAKGPDVAMVHRGETAPSTLKKRYFEEGIPLVGAYAWSMVGTWGGSVATYVPFSIRFLEMNTYSGGLYTSFASEYEATTSARIQLDPDKTIISSDLPQTVAKFFRAHMRDAGPEQNASGSRIYEAMQAMADPSFELDLPPQPPDLSPVSEGGKSAALDPIPAAIGKEAVKVGVEAPYEGGSAEKATMVLSAMTLTPGDFIEGMKGTRYLVVSNPADSSAGLSYMKIGTADSPLTGPSTSKAFPFSSSYGNEFRKLDAHIDLPKPKPVEGDSFVPMPEADQKALSPTGDAVLVGNLEPDTLIKVDEKVYKVDAASPTNASVISMDTGKKFTINAAYKTEPLGTLGVQVPFQAEYGDHIIIQHEGVEKIVKFLDKEKDEDGLQTGNIHVEFLPSVEDGVAETVSALGAHRIPASHYAPDGFEVGDQFSKDGKKWTVTSMLKDGTIRAKPAGGKVQKFSPNEAIDTKNGEWTTHIRPSDWSLDEKVKAKELKVGEFVSGSSTKVRPYRVIEVSEDKKTVTLMNLETAEVTTTTGGKSWPRLVTKVSSESPDDSIASVEPVTKGDLVIADLDFVSNAPIGTVLTTKQGNTWEKTSVDYWTNSTGTLNLSNDSMADGTENTVTFQSPSDNPTAPTTLGGAKVNDVVLSGDIDFDAAPIGTILKDVYADWKKIDVNTWQAQDDNTTIENETMMGTGATEYTVVALPGSANADPYADTGGVWNKVGQTITTSSSEIMTAKLAALPVGASIEVDGDLWEKEANGDWIGKSGEAASLSGATSAYLAAAYSNDSFTITAIPDAPIVAASNATKVGDTAEFTKADLAALPVGSLVKRAKGLHTGTIYRKQNAMEPPYGWAPVNSQTLPALDAEEMSGTLTVVTGGGKTTLTTLDTPKMDSLPMGTTVVHATTGATWTKANVVGEGTVWLHTGPDGETSTASANSDWSSGANEGTGTWLIAYPLEVKPAATLPSVGDSLGEPLPSDAKSAWEVVEVAPVGSVIEYSPNGKTYMKIVKAASDYKWYSVSNSGKEQLMNDMSGPPFVDLPPDAPNADGWRITSPQVFSTSEGLASLPEGTVVSSTLQSSKDAKGKYYRKIAAGPTTSWVEYKPGDTLTDAQLIAGGTNKAMAIKGDWVQANFEGEALAAPALVADSTSPKFSVVKDKLHFSPIGAVINSDQTEDGVTTWEKKGQDLWELVSGQLPPGHTSNEASLATLLVDSPIETTLSWPDGYNEWKISDIGTDSAFTPDVELLPGATILMPNGGYYEVVNGPVGDQAGVVKVLNDKTNQPGKIVSFSPSEFVGASTVTETVAFEAAGNDITADQLPNASKVGFTGFTYATYGDTVNVPVADLPEGSVFIDKSKKKWKVKKGGSKGGSAVIVTDGFQNYAVDADALVRSLNETVTTGGWSKTKGEKVGDVSELTDAPEGTKVRFTSPLAADVSTWQKVVLETDDGEVTGEGWENIEGIGQGSVLTSEEVATGIGSLEFLPTKAPFVDNSPSLAYDAETGETNATLPDAMTPFKYAKWGETTFDPIGDTAIGTEFEDKTKTKYVVVAHIGSTTIYENIATGQQFSTTSENRVRVTKAALAEASAASVIFAGNGAVCV